MNSDHWTVKKTDDCWSFSSLSLCTKGFVMTVPGPWKPLLTQAKNLFWAPGAIEGPQTRQMWHIIEFSQ